MTDEHFSILVAGVAAAGLLVLGLLKLYWRVDQFLNDPLPVWDFDLVP